MADGTWTQLWVVAPPGNGYTTPDVMKRIDDHIVNHGACFVSRPTPGGLPIQGDDGSWEVRCFGINTDKMIAQILTRPLWADDLAPSREPRGTSRWASDHGDCSRDRAAESRAGREPEPGSGVLHFFGRWLLPGRQFAQPAARDMDALLRFVR